MLELRKELKSVKAENARLKRQALRAASKSKSQPKKAKSTPKSETKPKGVGKVKSPSKRLYNPAKIFEKECKLIEEQRKRLLKQCTFKPSLKKKANKASKNAGKKASERLFEYAKSREKKQIQQRAKYRNREIANCTFSPAIDKKSNKIATGTSRGDAFARLSEPRVKPTKQHESVSFIYAYFEAKRIKTHDSRIAEYFDKNFWIFDKGLSDKDLIECTFTPVINTERPNHSNQGSTHDRLYAEALLRQSKRDQIQAAKARQKEEEEIDGCTFSPVINNNPEMGSKNGSSIVERLYYQDSEARRTRMQTLVKNAKDKITFQPKVRKNKKYLAAQATNADNVVDRLYHLSRSQKPNDYIDPECTFTPEITELAAEIDRGDIPAHERLALEMSPSQKIALADMDDYYEDEEYYGEEEDGYYEEEEEEYYEEDDMEEIDEEEEEMELP